MIARAYAGLRFFEFEIFQQFKNHVTHAVLSKDIKFDDSATISKILGTKNPPHSFINQLHGVEATILRDKDLEGGALQTEGDILITARAQTSLLIRIADCASILVFDPVKNVVANVHAGWRGLAQRVVRSAITHMRESFGSAPADFYAGISPMLGPCCSFFSDPKKELPRFMHRFISDENTVNLWAAAQAQLAEMGVPKNHIENARVCTFCNPEDFYSYRREGGENRFATAIMLK